MTPNDQLPDPADEKMSGIISELRQFLSDVKEDKKPLPTSELSSLPPSSPNHVVRSEPPPVAQDPEPPMPFFGASSGPALDEPMSSPIGEPEPGASPAGLPSDSEFWNGNVLGWPSIGDDQALNEDSSVTPFFAESTTASDKEELAPSPFLETSVSSAPPNSAPSAGLPTEERKEESHIISDLSPFAAFGSALGAAPQPQPVPPISPQPTEKESAPTSPFSSVTNDSMQVGPNLLPVDYGTKESDKSDGVSTDTEEAHLTKPEHIIHVACIVPSGQEKKGQQFFSKLKDFGLRAKSKLEIEAVFIHDWSADLIDVSAWEKSALLSGADVMFIVAAHSDFDKFHSVVKPNSVEAMPKRLISLEQIPLQNLYADLLWMLSGKAYVKS